MNTSIHPPIGSISTGTMRPRDLIPLFHTALECINDDAREVASSIYACHFGDEDKGWPSDESWWWDHAEASEYLDELFDALDTFAPPYCRFGAHEGDSSDYGFWPSMDALQEAIRDDDNVIQVADMADVPRGFYGYVVHVSDHGNVTLYAPVRVEYEEVWAVV